MYLFIHRFRTKCTSSLSTLESFSMAVVLQYYLYYHKPHLFHALPSEGLNRTPARRECFFIAFIIHLSILKDLMGSSSTQNTKMALSHHLEKN